MTSQPAIIKRVLKQMILGLKDKYNPRPIVEEKYDYERHLKYKIRIYCKYGHLMQGRADGPGRQWCKRCVKINQQRLRKFGNER